MRFCAFLFTLLGTGAASASSAGGPGHNWDSLIAQLQAVDTVSASAVGNGGTPGEFWKLSKLIIRQGKEEDFRRLLMDERPVVRSMGLLALGQTCGGSTVSTLRSHLTDRAMIQYMPGGCIGSTITVGQFARELLFDVNHLEHSPSAPLLSERELIGLDIEMLAQDRAAACHDAAARELTKAIDAPRLPPRLTALREYAPSLREYEIVKAIGRLQPSQRQRALLCECLRDGALSPYSRLAAASALTCDTSEESLHALQGELSFLNRIEESKWGSQFIETWHTRKTHEKNMEPIRAERTWRGMEKIKDKVIIAFTLRHPLALADLLNSSRLAIVADHPDVRQILADSLIAISCNLEDYSQPWSTYSDTAFELDLMIRQRQAWKDQLRRLSTEQLPEHMLTLRDDECAEIEKNIRPFLHDSSRDSQL